MRGGAKRNNEKRQNRKKKKDCEEMNELLSIVGANEKHVICFFVISLLGLCQQFHTHYAAVFLFFHFSIVKK